MNAVTVGSICSGIGGIDLGLERAGMAIRWQAETDPYASRVLAKHWPDVANLGDITQTDWSAVDAVDLICGGYPCQPFSLAGKRAGEEDPRHLWPYVLLAIRALRPRWAVLENVAGHLSLGFGRVLGDLAESGYDTDWDCIPAAAVGAPHRRDRVFIVAHTDSHALRAEPVEVGRSGGQNVARDDGPQGALADAASERRERWPSLQGAGRHSPIGEQALGDARHGRGPQLADTDRPRRPIFQGGSPLTERAGRRAAGGAGWWDVEPDVGRVADGVPHRVDRLRGLGNAVVPQVAEWIGNRIMEQAA